MANQTTTAVFEGGREATMNGPGRDEAPFSGRVWQEIDQTIAAVRAANCTARRFLEIDGPYGLGLTSVAGDDGWLAPAVGVPDAGGAPPGRWNVLRPDAREPNANPAYVRQKGTYMVSGRTRAVPLIASDFDLGMRAVEAFEAGCQPLDVCHATRAARDVALEEERLIYYGLPDDNEALLTIVAGNATPIPVPIADPIAGLHAAIAALAARGYAGPFALAADPVLYTQLYSPTATALGGAGGAPSVLYVDLLRNLFRGGIFLAPVIEPAADPAPPRRGAIVTVGLAYSRLVVGQDWVTAYRGRDGVLYRFLIMSSLQLRICDHASIQVLVEG
jgi:uncharacterized linocin/CFP29 family protein